jgi:adenylate cyclase
MQSTADDPWPEILLEGHKPLKRMRGFMRHLPGEPRCKACNNPFGGVGGRICAIAGFTPSRKNPNLCRRCCEDIPPGGAEVDIAVLFADVRGSTALCDRMGAGPYAELMNRFYRAATKVLLAHDAVIDKLVGDEVMALFIPGIAGPDYRRRAVDAALDLQAATGHGGSGEPWLPLGVAVDAGVAYVGNVGEAVVDFTALGDPVNTAARLQAEARAGQVIVSAGLHDGLEERLADAERRTFDVRGRAAPVNALVV